MTESRAGFPVDEQPLRDCILKAYHEDRDRSKKCRQAVDSVRQFLSGPPGGEPAPERYWFQESPEASIKSFLVDLDRADQNFVRSVFEPLMTAVGEMEREKRRSLARNLPVYVSSLSGSSAVKANVDETVASAVVAAAILGLSRLGRAPFERVLAEHGK